LNFILLYECESKSVDDSNGTKYYVYEVFSTTFYALSPNDSEEEVELQKILWSPASYDSSSFVNSQKKVLPSSKNKVKTIEKSKISQAIAFIHDYDIYYKPKIHSDLVIRVTSSGEFIYVCDVIIVVIGEIREMREKAFT
jgi:Dipeptidyl peptidase IV (DPP IV) N-terminal region